MSTDPWLELLLFPVSNGPLVVFRWLFGTLLAIFAVRRYREKVEQLVDGLPHVGFELTRFLRPLGPGPMKLLFAAEMPLAIAFAVGLWGSWAALLLLAVRAYLLLLDRARYKNHDYLICLLLFLYVVVDANALGWVPRWQLLIVQVQIVLVYFFGGVAKLNHDWLIRAMPFRARLETEVRPGLPGLAPGHVPNARIAAWWRALSQRKQVAYFFCWSGMAFDLSAGFLLMHAATQPWALAPFLFFHAFNRWFYGLGIFPYLSIAALALFMGDWAVPEGAPSAVAGVDTLVFFFLYLAVQLLVPLRRYVAYVRSRGRMAVSGDHHHHFSWTMKLVQCRSESFSLEVFDRSTGKSVLPVLLHRLVGARAYDIVSRSPRALILLLDQLEQCFAHEPILADIDFGLRVHMCVSINRGKPFVAIDPTVDLRGQRVKIFGSYPWQRFGPPLDRGSLTSASCLANS